MEKQGLRWKKKEGKLLEASPVCELFLGVVALIFALILGQVKLKGA